MKKSILLGVAILVALGVLGQSNQKGTKDITAVVVKVIRDVTMRGPSTGWQTAVPLSQLKSGYEVKTEKGSLAMILFADQSKLIVREKSIVTIRGEVQGREILNRNVHMDRGNIIFNVKKAETEQFRFSSPISVASIRGTQGGYTAGGNEDNLIITEGLAEFMNSLSGRSMNVASGQRGTADSTGNLNVENASDEELNDIRRGQDIKEEQEEESQPETELALRASVLFTPSPVAGKATTIRIEFQPAGTTLDKVVLQYRKKGEASFSGLTLKVDGNKATGEIPASGIQTPALEYYCIVTSGSQTVTVPKDGSSSPWSVGVMSALVSGNIVATPTFSPMPLRAFVPAQVALDIQQGDVQSATLWYRYKGESNFKNLSLTLEEKKATGTIPGGDVLAPMLEYYFVLTEQTGGEVTLPADGATTPLSVAVGGESRITAEFSKLKSRRNGFVRVNFAPLRINVQAVHLFHRKAGEQTFVDLPLTISGRQATGKIEGEHIRYPHLEYYLVITLENGRTITEPEGGDSKPHTIAVEPVERTLRIPGQTSSLQKKTIVLKWKE